MDLILFKVAGVIGGQVLQVKMDPLPSIYLNGPVAPQRRVGAQVVRGEKLTTVVTQQLVATPQGKESTVVPSLFV